MNFSVQGSTGVETVGTVNSSAQVVIFKDQGILLDKVSQKNNKICRERLLYLS